MCLITVFLVNYSFLNTRVFKSVHYSCLLSLFIFPLRTAHHRYSDTDWNIFPSFVKAFVFNPVREMLLRSFYFMTYFLHKCPCQWHQWGCRGWGGRGRRGGGGGGGPRHQRPVSSEWERASVPGAYWDLKSLRLKSTLCFHLAVFCSFMKKTN